FGMIFLAAMLQLGAQWDAGAADCKSHRAPPIEVHAYNPQTYILRENLCATFEAPFMYLLIGSTRALLIDDGDVADPKAMPIAQTVLGLLPPNLPLLVVHTHRHLDHRAADPQFSGRPNVQVVGYDLESVKRFYGFSAWPDGIDTLDLGGRTVDVLPTPGHNETHVAFYDRNTALFFTGDFLMPGRLLIDDATADRASARRVAAFIATRPVTAVLGGHIELDSAGHTFDFYSNYHPHERALEMTKADLLALPAALDRFNGFYAKSGSFIMIDQMRVLIAEALGALIVLVVLIFAIVKYFRGRRT
ncbi:MAG TPA: MBL fold metallo-hydrolase, partial [Gemmatimonadaceae bacterium]|nr:MBL fold metallo-hydrolase [Gemmatimonadaceae bacterium]